ncbi:MAG TPA: class I SAM-dependent methyltransferase [Flavisolibacter sp.]|jgi:2-polyprenyl-3-methyl-5-hydroxy-6-metoxy-1,4-benzoquinol methylase
MDNYTEEIWNNTAQGWSEHINNRPEADLYRNHILHPMLLQLLGDVKDKKVLDAGCGEGYLSRMLADMGAKVTSVDIAEKMLELAQAREAEKPRNISFAKASLTDLSGIDEKFNIVVSNLVLNIIPVYKEVFVQLANVLDMDGTLVVSLPHPCFDGVGAGLVEIPDQGTRWSVNRYIDEVGGYAAHGAPTFHRPLSAYMNAAFEAGFVLTGFLEPVTPRQYSEMFPDHIRQYDRIPSMVGMRFRKS